MSPAKANFSDNPKVDLIPTLLRNEIAFAISGMFVSFLQ